MGNGVVKNSFWIVSAVQQISLLLLVNSNTKNKLGQTKASSINVPLRQIAEEKRRELCNTSRTKDSEFFLKILTYLASGQTMCTVHPRSISRFWKSTFSTHLVFLEQQDTRRPQDTRKCAWWHIFTHFFLSCVCLRDSLSLSISSLSLAHSPFLPVFLSRSRDAWSKLEPTIAKNRKRSVPQLPC